MTFEHRAWHDPTVPDPDGTERSAARSIIVRLPDIVQQRLERVCAEEGCEPEDWITIVIHEKLKETA